MLLRLRVIKIWDVGYMDDMGDEEDYAFFFVIWMGWMGDKWLA